MARLAFLFTLLIAFAAPAHAADGRRVALVVGNGDYTAVARLTNPAADAALIAAALKQAGFTSVDVKRNLGKAALENALREFGRKADGAELALVYYAGHGIEVGGQNYLVPVDAKLERDRDVDVEATRLDTLLGHAEGARLRVVILDACRNNPFVSRMERSVKTRSVGRGLAEVEPEGETLVVYAAKAGATASDGTGANSPFAEALARRLPEAGVEINMTFRRVRDDVLARTSRGQEPFTYGSLSSSEFYFVPGKPGSTSAPAAPALASGNVELEYWRGVTAADTEDAYRGYLKKYPKGEFTDLANENIKRLSQKAPASTSGAPAVAQSDGAAAQRSAGPTITEGLGAMTQFVTAIKDPRAAAQMQANAQREQQRLDQQARNDAARQQALERQQQLQQQQLAAREQQAQQRQQRMAGAQDAGTVSGTWRGQFVCDQSTASMQMVLQQASKGEVTGRFEFGGMGSRGVSGEFEVQGQLRGSRLQLTGGRWITQPAGYSARPNIEGALSADGRSMSGRLLSSNCGALNATRIGAAGGF
jgi:uncharacterized caspase-like protein